MKNNYIWRFFYIFWLNFILIFVNGEFVNDNFFGLSTVIGPDTYGLLKEYKTTYNSGFQEFGGTEVEVKKYLTLQSTLTEMAVDVYSKYKQVSAIFMSTSRFYYNYRHAGNVFAVLSQYFKYGSVSNKFMTPILPETCICHPTNTAAGRIYLDANVNLKQYRGKMSEDLSNIYNEDLLLKYNGHGLLKKHFRYAMTNRYPEQFPNSMKNYTQYTIDGDVDYNKFVYMTGHGGDSYLQFQAKDFISSLELGQNFKEMHIKSPKMKIFTLLDTCQASTMYKYVDESIPLVWVASSVKGESSYSHNPNPYISISTCDKFTFVLNRFLDTVLSGIVYGTNKASVSRLSLKQFLRNYERNSEKERIEFKVNKNIHEEEDSNKKMEKLYLGQFVFNYRNLYANSLKFHVRKNTEDLAPRFKCYKITRLKHYKPDK